jgi:hypothetical protein
VSSATSLIVRRSKAASTPARYSFTATPNWRHDSTVKRIAATFGPLPGLRNSSPGSYFDRVAVKSPSIENSTAVTLPVILFADSTVPVYTTVTGPPGDSPL